MQAGGGGGARGPGKNPPGLIADAYIAAKARGWWAGKPKKTSGNLGIKAYIRILNLIPEGQF
jgi:hypothetical protein